jgi:hypothetical protein
MFAADGIHVSAVVLRRTALVAFTRTRKGSGAAFWPVNR